MAATRTTLLSDIHLSKDIAELEDDVRLVWEPPDIYQEVFKDNVWLVYGRKGSGKSHLVDYLGKDKSNGRTNSGVIIIRPREDRLFPKVMTAISEADNPDERIVVENVASALEFIIFTLLMRRSMDVEGFLVAGPSRKAIADCDREN